MEAEISKVLVSFEKEYLGRGPVEGKAYIVQDIVLMRVKRVLTAAEIHLRKDEEGIQLVKQLV